MSIYVQGTEYDFGLLSPFGTTVYAPIKLPSGTTHYENDDVVVADAFQYLALPNEWGTHRVGFSLDSGPWGIHYIITGWVDVEATAPVVRPAIPTSARSLQMAGKPRGWASLSSIGQRAMVEHPNGHRSVLGLGPNGLLARRLPSDKFQRRQNWKMIESSGVEAASVVATEAGLHIIAVSAGVIRHRLEPVSEQESAADWREIGSGFQAHLSAFVLPEEAIAVIGMALDGTLRGMVLGRNSARHRWTELGGAFVGRVIALPKEDGVEIFGLTADGDIQTAIWKPESKELLSWKSLKGEPFNFFYVGEEEGSTHVIAVTANRQVHLLSRVKKLWSRRWASLGNLDNVEISR